jgi:formylglycine-generating enzyme required for sulfatase activity/tRNA A-37 threonylcarbamoyl transferase component Bud32
MFQEGQRLGEFEILGRLGQGGMGAVYKARQVSLRRTVAIKTLQAALAADAEYIVRFHNEAAAAAALNHPNLVQVYSAGESDGLHWFAMEYVEGESAQDRVKRKGRIEPVEAIAIVMHVATALEYGWRKAHLIHRDIKPDNIFLSGDGEVKLGDLGLAKVAEQTQGLTVTGASMGTPHYVSPEQAEGKKDVDLRADIYSLGCTLFHLLSGKPPYAGESALAVMMKHVSAPVPNLKQVWPECPEELAAAVMKMMLKAPAARQQSYGEVNTDLRRAYDVLTGASGPDVGTAAQQPAKERRFSTAGEDGGGGKAAVGKPPIPVRNRRSLVWAGVAVAVCVALGALLYFAPWKKDASGGAAASTKSIPSIAGLPKATKDKPFVNTLGMEFVPVPGTAVLFCRWETRVKDYTAYAKGNKVDAAWAATNKEGVPSSREPEHPVASVSWNDANGFCEWLTKKEIAEGKLAKGMKYRLPTDEEWSRAVGLAFESGATPSAKSGKNSVDFPWGTGFPPAGKVGNYADEAFHAKFPNKKAGEEDDSDVEKDPKAKNWIVGYTDGFATSAPVGSFPANEWGIHDLGGNVWEWCEDWYDASQKERVLRGASWLLRPGLSAVVPPQSQHTHVSQQQPRYPGGGRWCVRSLSLLPLYPLAFIPFTLCTAQQRNFFCGSLLATR